MKTFRFDEVVGDDRERLAPEIARERDEAVREIVTYQLAELRKAMGLTQSEIARAVGISQPTISKLEGRHAENLSILRGYIEALGGHLELAAVFDEYKVILRGFTDDAVADESHVEVSPSPTAATPRPSSQASRQLST